MNRRYSHLVPIHLSLLLYLRFFYFFLLSFGLSFSGMLVGLGTEFCSEKKFREIHVDSEQFSLFRGVKCSFQRHSEVHGSEARNGTVRIA
jgi:hypothetical protein